MSREFGDYGGGGYFHSKVESALNDLKEESRDEFHRKFIPLFEELYLISYAIASVEAGDSCIDRSIFQTMESIPKMERWIEKMNQDLEVYRRVAQEAIRNRSMRKLLK